jgi:predicted AlkP superfamily pyrophosphatase or phosphodiesterase
MLKRLRSVLSFAVLCLAASQAVMPVQAAGPPRDMRVLLVVWDGLRPDMINAADTPNLASLRDGGVNFTDHHSTYPTLTMINASSLATGAFPGTHG